MVLLLRRERQHWSSLSLTLLARYAASKVRYAASKFMCVYMYMHRAHQSFCRVRDWKSVARERKLSSQ